jgi:hypothetical protein
MTGVRPSTLLLAQGGDELAAEVGDVGDHAAPDPVGSGREPLEQVFAGLLGCFPWTPLSRLVCVLVWPREEGRREGHRR